MRKPRRLLIAGGGTGGHLFPAIALAQAFCDRCPHMLVLFVGTRRPFEIREVAKAGFAHVAIRAAGIKGRRLAGKLDAFGRVAGGIFESMALMLRFKPDLVLGVGGYSAGPVVLAAWLCRRKIVLHEQNLRPGLTNRLLAPLADCIFVAFDESVPAFGGKRVRVTGIPLRRELSAGRADAGADGDAGGKDERKKDVPTVLITGGSQGARRINSLMIGALERLAGGREIRFVHQTGAADEARVRAAYMRLGLEAQVKSFFDDLPRRYRSCDLAVCRAGAVTVAELAAAGCPAIYIPYPFAADNHQWHNAHAMAAAGAGEVIAEEKLTADRLAERIIHYIENPRMLAQMGRRAAARAKPDAATVMVEHCCRLLAGAAC